MMEFQSRDITNVQMMTLETSGNSSGDRSMWRIEIVFETICFTPSIQKNK